MGKRSPPPNNEWLKSRYRALGWTQQTLAAELGVSPSRISELVTGNRRLQFQEIVPMARALKMPIGDLVMAFGPDEDESARDARLDRVPPINRDVMARAVRAIEKYVEQEDARVSNRMFNNLCVVAYDFAALHGDAAGERDIEKRLLDFAKGFVASTEYNNGPDDGSG